MKKAKLIVALTVFVSANVWAQTPTPEITKKNSWLKAGLTAGVPVGDISEVSNFTLGLDLKGQLMSTNHIGIGLTTGYNHFFVKDGFESFGTIPLGVFMRVYPDYKGFFAGTDLGYSLLTGTNNNKGGVYVRPQLGYHNYDWNIFGFYNHIFRGDVDGGAIQTAGIGFTYNLRFN